MSGLEHELRDALRVEAAAVTPSADLFDRVRDSVHDAKIRRRRRIVWVSVSAAVGGLVVALMVWGMTTASGIARPRGGTNVNWWVLELLTTAALVVLAVWLGPFIKRFGRAYAADVFHDNPLTGKSYIVLTDIVYYLIFFAYILWTTSIELDTDWYGGGFLSSDEVAAGQIQWELQRIAGILLIIGLLHGLNIVIMPVLGRLFSLNRRLGRPTTIAPSERERIDG